MVEQAYWQRSLNKKKRRLREIPSSNPKPQLGQGFESLDDTLIEYGYKLFLTYLPINFAKFCG